MHIMRCMGSKYAFYEVLKIDELLYLKIITSYVLVRRAPGHPLLAEIS